MLQLLDPAGELRGEAPVDLDETRRLYAAMVEARAYDRKCTALQKQGRLATYAPFEGQEAAQVGAAAALRPDDWVVATYRDAALMWMQGYTWEALVLGRTGDERGGSPPEGVNVMPPSITVGAHMLHAVGLAWGERVLGSNRVALTSFGDGATSEGDFHEAMNFAAVFSTATVFLCQNNQYAISLARATQTRAETIADKAVAYGMPGEQVDGNDLFAVLTATRAAVASARNGAGPTLIEAVTYRMGPHTTSDDPGRYRPAEEVEQWRELDPLERVRLYLESQELWDEEWQRELDAAASERIERAVDTAEGLDPLPATDPFERMFASTSLLLAEQRDEAR
jgi:2-oxoisovalerate dehydrogenase E1 component alpha subunit